MLCHHQEHLHLESGRNLLFVLLADAMSTAMSACDTSLHLTARGGVRSFVRSVGVQVHILVVRGENVELDILVRTEAIGELEHLSRAEF